MSHHGWGIFLTLWCPGYKSYPLTEIEGGEGGNWERHQKDVIVVVLVSSLLLTLNWFQTFVRGFYFWLRTGKCGCAWTFPAGIYLLKVNNRNTRTRCEVCSKLIMKTPEWRQWGRSGVFIVNYEHISHLGLVFLSLTLSR